MVTIGAYDSHKGVQEEREEQKKSESYLSRGIDAISKGPAGMARAPAEHPYKTLTAVGAGLLYSGAELADGEGPIAGQFAEAGESAYEAVVNAGSQGAGMIAAHPDETQQALETFSNLF